MKIYLLQDNNAGPMVSRLAQMELALAAKQQALSMVTDLSAADIVIVIGEHIPAKGELVGKKVRLLLPQAIFNDAGAALTQALQSTTILQQLPQATVDATPASTKRIVAVTACPTGVAHTFMAAEAIEEEAKKRGFWCKVETRGSVGANNAITAEEIAVADVVIVAADIDVDLSKFAGKPMYRTKTGPALKKTAQVFDEALSKAQIYQPAKANQSASSGEKKGLYQHLLTGVSYMLPMVVAGGLIIALAFAFGEFKVDPADGLSKLMPQADLSAIGGAAFGLMVPLLAGYIAYSIADRPGLVPGLVGGVFATSIGAGFLGGIVIGYFAGYVALLLSKYLRLPQSMEALKPILLIPLLATLASGLMMLFVFGPPIAALMKNLELWLNNVQTANAVLLGIVLGGMMCADMGGPINKVAYAFSVGMLSAHQYAPMAAAMAAGMVPPLAMSLATFLGRNKFNNDERQSGKAAFVLGLCFISEGAIPFAARDPLRVIPCCIIGGAISGGMALAFGAKLMTPHGGLFALLIPGVINPVLGYLLAIAAGSLVAGVLYAIIKRREVAPVSLA